MRLFVTILFLFVSVFLNAQFGQPRIRVATPIPPDPPGGTVNLTFNQIGANTEYQRYGGASNWNLEDGAKIVSGYAHTTFYFRLTWYDCESSTVQGDYSKLWTGRFRQRVIMALDSGKLFAFGIMQRYPELCSSGGFNSGEQFGGACLTYPRYVHEFMQGNGNNDWNDFNDGTTWIEAANNPLYQDAWSDLHEAIMNWLDTATYTPSSGPRAGQLITFKDALAYVDVRGCGSYGEWHNCCLNNGYDLICNWPGVEMVEGNCFGTIETYGTYATPQTMKNIIDAQVDAYTNYPCVIIINSLDGNRFGNTKIIAEVGIYALTKTNTFGKIGLRRDQWGDDADYYQQILEDNTMTFGGVRADTAILNRYKYNYFTGEPPGYNCNNASSVCRNGVNFGWLPDQADTLHPYSVGNGNWGGNAPTNQSSVDSIRKFFRKNGPRVTPTGGTMTQTLQAGANFNVTLSMANNGLAVEHRAWTAQVILKNSGGTTVFTGTHSFTVKGFLPTAGTSVDYSTNFTLGGGVTPAAGHNLYLKLIDPLDYAQPYYLGLVTRESDGSYLVRSNITVLAGP